jgi:hypothetical protein
VPDAAAECLPVNLRITVRGRLTVPHVVHIDFCQSADAASRLNRLVIGGPPPGPHSGQDRMGNPSPRPENRQTRGRSRRAPPGQREQSPRLNREQGYAASTEEGGLTSSNPP